jgi:hypothetical protein
MPTAPAKEAVLDKINDFWFVRKDTYARSYLKEDGSMGYSPACGCSPSCRRGSKCPNWQPLPVTGEVIYNHLKAKDVRPYSATIGTYGVSPHDEAKWVCLDVDAHAKGNQDQALRNARSTVRMLSLTLRDANLPYYVEHSGSGYHVWTFTGTPAGIAHRAGKALVQRTLDGIETLPAPVEVYPKQGSIDAFGNLVKLPLGLHYSGRRTVFLDPTTFAPVQDQWGYLLDFERADVVTLSKLALEYQPAQRALPMAAVGATGGEVQAGPPCVANMLKARLGDGGGRNNILFQLAVDLRRAGLVDEEAALLVLEPWNERQIAPLSPREFHGTVQSAFRGRFSYGCERDYMSPYCEADTCPIFLGQQRRQEQQVPPADAPVALTPRREPDPTEGIDLNRYVRDAVYKRGFRYNNAALS